MAFLAAEALGAENVTAVRMPYRTSSPESLAHAQLVIDQLGIPSRTVDITAGVDGIVSSGLEAPMIRKELGPRLLVVTPGIRPVENKPTDDQKRTVDVPEAFSNGADYIVVGRPIRQAADPRQAALAIQRTIAELFGAG